MGARTKTCASRGAFACSAFPSISPKLIQILASPHPMLQNLPIDKYRSLLVTAELPRLLAYHPQLVLLTKTTSASCLSAMGINPRKRAGDSSNVIRATLRANAGSENPCPSGPRRFSCVPGFHGANAGSGAARNPFGAESLKKTGTASGDVRFAGMGEEILPGRRNQFGRADDPRAGIQINFI